MRYLYVCDDCLNDIRKEVKLNVKEFNAVCMAMAMEVEHPMGRDSDGDIVCKECNGTNLRKLLTVGTIYTKGYGYLDRKGANVDKDLYLMLTNNDPYAEHRKTGDKNEIIRKLRKSKEFNPKTKTIGMSSKTSI